MKRLIAQVVVVLALIGAYHYYTAESHLECTQEVRTRDGSECVGDYVRVKGNDLGSVVLMLIIAGIAAGYVVADHETAGREHS